MRKGDGKIEIFACRDDVLSLLRQGYGVSRIHAELSASGKVTAKKSQFYELVRKFVFPLLREPEFHPRSRSSSRIGPRLASEKAVPTPVSTPDRDEAAFPVALAWDPGRKIKWE